MVSVKNFHRSARARPPPADTADESSAVTTSQVTPSIQDFAVSLGTLVPYRPAPGIAVYHIRLDDYVVMAAEHDLAGPLLDLVTAVMALGSEC